MNWINIILTAVVLPLVVESLPDNLPQFLDQPSSLTAKIGSRARLKCAGSTLGSKVRWYFNGTLISDADDSSVTRRKRTRGSENMSLIKISSRIRHGGLIDDVRDFNNPEYSSNLPYYSRRKKLSSRKRRKRGVAPKLRQKRGVKQPAYISNNLYIYKRHFRRKTPAVSASKIFVNINDNKQRGRLKRKRRSISLSPDFLSGIDVREGRLIISPFSEAHIGQYYCDVTNDVGTIRSRIATVSKAEIADFPTSQSTNLRVAKGDSVVIPCQMPLSVPTAQPRWRIDDLQWMQKSNGKYSILETGELIIGNVTATSGVRFQCGAYNDVLKSTKISSAITLLEITDTKTSESEIIFPNVPSTHEITFIAGQNVILPCVGSSTDTVHWIHNGQPISKKNVKITTAGLSISGISPQNSGQYKCYGSDANEATVYIVSVSRSPEVLINMSQEFSAPVTSGSEFKRKCEDSNNGDDVIWFWYKDGKLLDDDSDVLVQENIVTVKSQSHSVSGVYQCVAKNEAGQDFASIHVEVQDDLMLSSTTSPEKNGNEDEDSVSYFDAPVDETGLPAPVVTSGLRTTDPVSYELSWKLLDNSSRVKTIAIRCAKSIPPSGGDSSSAYTWVTQSVPASKTSIVLDHLEPSSLYQLELVSVSEEGKTSQIVTTSFRTGEIPNHVPQPSLPEKPKNTGTPKNENNKIDKTGGLPDPPTRPEPPSVTPISVTSVSLMWVPRSNGGSPIEGYRVEMREVDNGKRGWQVIEDNLDAGKHSCEVNGLDRDKKYRFRVIAFNSGGDSKPSSASEMFPKTKSALRLKSPPIIINRTTKSASSVLLEWMYDDPIGSTVEGYHIHFRSSDKDSERDYNIMTIPGPTDTSATITDLTPGIQYDIKITAFNSRGPSPPSTVTSIELPRSEVPGKSKPGTEYKNPDVSRHNDEALQKVKEKDLIYLITGGVLGLVVIILVLSVFCYWRRKAKWDKSKSPGTNGCAVKYVPGHDIHLSKMNSSNHTPSDTKCTCSRHHSDHSSLERDEMLKHRGQMYGPYVIPDGRYHDSSQGSPYPHIHNNPMHMYMDYRDCTAYFHPNMGRGNVPPIMWMRTKNGAFCHIPGDARKITTDGLDPGVNNFGGGGAMVMRRYQSNVANGLHDGIVRMPNENYNKEYENNNIEGEEEEITVHNPSTNCDSNSDGVTTSGVVTQSDATLSSSRLSQDVSEEDECKKRHSKSSSSDRNNHDLSPELPQKHLLKDISSSISSNSDNEFINEDINESSSFLSSNVPSSYRKETVIS